MNDDILWEISYAGIFIIYSELNDEYVDYFKLPPLTA